jgi:hypothetical protein
MLPVTRRYLGTCALVLLALPAAAAQLDTTDLLHCHAITSGEQKLACYEALAMSAQSEATTAAESARQLQSAPSAPSVASASAVGPAAPGAAAPGPSAPGTAAVGSPTPATAAANPNTEDNFGLNRRQIEPRAAEGPASIKSAVSQMTEDRLHNITVVLDNGQTWAFIEPEPRLRPGDAVTIKRASLGSFLMLTPSRRSYRVERLK